MYTLERNDEEIDAVLDKVAEITDQGGSRWPGMSYEEGVRAGINWLIGSDDESPMQE